MQHTALVSKQKRYIHVSTLPHKIMCRLGGYFNDNYCYYKRQIERIKRKYDNIAHRRSKRIFLSNNAICTSNILRFYAYLAKNILRFQKKVVPSDAALCLKHNSPRKYVREMQPILQHARTFENRLRLLNQPFTHHLHMQASDVAVNN